MNPEKSKREIYLFAGWTYVVSMTLNWTSMELLSILYSSTGTHHAPAEINRIYSGVVAVDRLQMALRMNELAVPAFDKAPLIDWADDSKFADFLLKLSKPANANEPARQHPQQSNIRPIDEKQFRSHKLGASIVINSPWRVFLSPLQQQQLAQFHHWKDNLSIAQQTHIMNQQYQQLLLQQQQQLHQTIPNNRSRSLNNNSNTNTTNIVRHRDPATSSLLNLVAQLDNNPNLSGADFGISNNNTNINSNFINNNNNNNLNNLNNIVNLNNTANFINIATASVPSGISDSPSLNSTSIATNNSGNNTPGSERMPRKRRRTSEDVSPSEDHETDSEDLDRMLRKRKQKKAKPRFPGVDPITDGTRQTIKMEEVKNKKKKKE